ncbi:copper transport protein ATOX1 [Patella vulgata]|uniref:copper transport protein ATOX1 n=1 Tax=Patella vulgata TaxID=6465 RepID=UPI00217F679D|nr:copper transport protein ATOX1 [Patella vulgata]
MADKKHEFQMEMTCEGCAGAAQRVLGKLEGVSNVETSVADQRVLVTSNLSSDILLETLKKTGKACSYIGTK